ncbi:MAG: hypothetical protein IT286_00460, partial [Proteobacteria bacterium]|nr:hypothetical protein [Pseudomonadota bacterium]
MIRGTSLTSPFIFAGMLLLSTAHAQQPSTLSTPQQPLQFKSTPSATQPKSLIEQKLTKDRVQKGYFGLSVGSKVNQYKSLPAQATIKSMDHTRVQQGLASLQRSTQAFRLDSLIKIQSTSLPQFRTHQPNITLAQLEMIVDKKAIEQFLNHHLSQFQPLANAWEGHLSSMGNIINQANVNSIVDIPALSQTLLNYINQHQLLSQAQIDWSQLQNIDWGNISIHDFIREDVLQNTLDELSYSANLNMISAQNFLDQTNEQMNQTFEAGLNHAIYTIRKNGFSLDNGKLNFQDPNNPSNRFSFTPGNSSASGSCTLTPNGEFSGSFVLNAGDCLTLQGSANFSTQGTLNTLASTGEQRLQNIVALLQDSLQSGASLDQLLSSLQGELNQISNSALPSVIAAIRDNFDSDFSLTLNLQKISDGFTGTGDYQYIDIILETLGHDVGEISLNKRQIIDIATLMMEGNESQVGQYILEDVAGFETDIVGYNIARDVANTYLSEHFQGNIIALQMGIAQNGGMIQTGPTYFGSALIRNGEKARWVATGSFNQRSINNSPVLKEDGLLHLRTELVSNSIGLAYIPRIWNNKTTKTSLTGIVQIEGLLV